MQEKFTVDLFDKDETENLIKTMNTADTFIKSGSQTKKSIDPMAMGLSLMSNPKRLKKILIAVVLFSVIGILTTTYGLVTGLIYLIDYLLNKL